LLGPADVARTALLLGLNCGFTKADIGELVEQEHVINGGTHISKVRSRLRHKKTKVKPVWWLWPETKVALQFGLPSRDVDREYTKFRTKFNLPEHKALRKTTAQVIEDHVAEYESMLFRGESKSGTHHKNYIKKYTPEQVAKLDAALQTARKVLFGVE
jgi:hypothetical protein